MDTQQAYVTLSVSGADQRINITENATAALLFDAVANTLGREQRPSSSTKGNGSRATTP